MYYLIKTVIQKYLLYGSSLLYKINLSLFLSLCLSLWSDLFYHCGINKLPLILIFKLFSNTKYYLVFRNSFSLVKAALHNGYCQTLLPMKTHGLHYIIFFIIPLICVYVPWRQFPRNCLGLSTIVCQGHSTKRDKKYLLN